MEELPRALPAGTTRLFAHYGDSLVAEHDPFLIGRLLEDGDSQDLAWLFAEVGAEAVRSWFRRAGGRQLSRRSRAFWAVVLDEEPGPAAEGAEELWCL
ncbi:MAG TPA: hypothetical protein VF017_04530 [Thermoanaerobaculia bacterium]|nr:hypothetical protein [Thermoanaerobaculia bacterium]